jgi:hypothetical protein
VDAQIIELRRWLAHSRAKEATGVEWGQWRYAAGDRAQLIHVAPLRDDLSE